jgi:hypothetical protein
MHPATHHSLWSILTMHHESWRPTKPPELPSFNMTMKIIFMLTHTCTIIQQITVLATHPADAVAVFNDCTVTDCEKSLKTTTVKMLSVKKIKKNCEKL